MQIDYWQTLHEKAFYHIYNRTNGNDLLFANSENQQFFLKKWHLYLNDYLDTYAYCLMSNHFHFVVKVKYVDDQFKMCVQKENTTAAQAFLLNKITVDAFLEDQFKRFFSSYAKAFNKQQNRHGALFQPSFKRVQLISLAHVLDKIAYLHHNPLHHHMSAAYETWVHSSYTTYLSNKPTNLKRLEGLKLFSPSSTVEPFVVFHQDYHKKWLCNKPQSPFNDDID